MASSETAAGAAPPRQPPPLPAALSGERRDIPSAAGRLSYYAGSPATDAADQRPLLLVHSVNAAASAYEIKPLYEHYAARRPTYALDLPGYGFSDRSERPYTPRLMTDAVLALIDVIAERHGHDTAIDALALSLGSEFLARAASERPARFRSLALVSPTGFDRRAPLYGAPGSDLGMAWLYRTFTARPVSRTLWRNLTRPAVIRFFLDKTWGSNRIDEGMMTYDVLTTRQPGACHAPFRFVSGYLFSADITHVHEALTHPVWLVHGVRGDFVDYRYKAAFEGRPNWSIRVMPTGAMPHFELPADFIAGYDAFLADAGPVASA